MYYRVYEGETSMDYDLCPVDSVNTEIGSIVTLYGPYTMKRQYVVESVNDSKDVVSVRRKYK